MPVYHFTFHAYRTWRPDNPEGYVKRKHGILPADEQMAQRYDTAASQPPIQFENEHQRVLIDSARDVASRRNWRIHAIATEPTHVHILVSWPDENAQQWKHVQDKLKQLLGMMLSQHFGQSGRKWFVRKSSRKRVRKREHFEYLMTDYLPSHRGRFWSERSKDIHNR